MGFSSMDDIVSKGEGTAIHRGLQALQRAGWDAGPWAAAIDGERKTVTP